MRHVHFRLLVKRRREFFRFLLASMALISLTSHVWVLGLKPNTHRERKSETAFENGRSVSCGPVRIRGFHDDSAYRSRRRLLHYEWRSSSSWLRLSEYGGMPGGILRHRRFMFVQCPRQNT